eukprot:gnl/Spiro4/15488_TR8340_c0_g1_i1.p1 gnl/Spiro4/15488_TR8340_c0_g1~~gnl/Spiro4/15488_TR8340_c0_g1_i1.p1  ORF type:complete len:119 (+),score=16.22 gnl/Spiro4/15488_TR8340_c0_g1_i1:25-357(+)
MSHPPISQPHQSTLEGEGSLKLAEDCAVREREQVEFESHKSVERDLETFSKIEQLGRTTIEQSSLHLAELSKMMMMSQFSGKADFSLARRRPQLEVLEEQSCLRKHCSVG